MTEDVLTTREAARYLRIGIETLKRKAQLGEVPAGKVGRQWRFLKVALDRWLVEGGDLERYVDAGLLAVAEERAQDPQDQEDIPWAAVKARLGLAR
jgi:excisionase family DNA binding protein